MTVLLAGNVSAESNAFGGAGPTNLGQLETAFQADDDAFTLGVDKLFYSAGIGRTCWRCGPVPIPMSHFWMNSRWMENPGDPSGHIKRRTIEPPAIDRLIRLDLINR